MVVALSVTLGVFTLTDTTLFGDLNVFTILGSFPAT